MSERQISVLLAASLIVAAMIVGYLVGSGASRRRFNFRAALVLTFAIAVLVAVIASVERL